MDRNTTLSMSIVVVSINNMSITFTCFMIINITLSFTIFVGANSIRILPPGWNSTNRQNNIQTQQFQDMPLDGLPPLEGQDASISTSGILQNQNTVILPPGGQQALPPGDSASVCHICGKKFNNRHNVLRHVLVHTGERPFCCTVCGKSFNQKVVLKKHMWTLHNVHLQD